MREAHRVAETPPAARRCTTSVSPCRARAERRAPAVMATRLIPRQRAGVEDDRVHLGRSAMSVLVTLPVNDSRVPIEVADDDALVHEVVVVRPRVAVVGDALEIGILGARASGAECERCSERKGGRAHMPKLMRRRQPSEGEARCLTPSVRPPPSGREAGAFEVG